MDLIKNWCEISGKWFLIWELSGVHVSSIVNEVICTNSRRDLKWKKTQNKPLKVFVCEKLLLLLFNIRLTCIKLYRGYDIDDYFFWMTLLAFLEN